MSSAENDTNPLAELATGIVLLCFALYGVYSGQDTLALASLSLVALVGCVRSYTRTVEVVNYE